MTSTNVVMNYTETEAKVREATNDEAWGPTGAILQNYIYILLDWQELAQATFTYEQFPEVMGMLWKRMLQDNRKNWRRTYKSLVVLQYLLRNGSERVVTSSREHVFDLRSLENYSFIDEQGKDQGLNIRHKVKDLIAFIQDDERLREERKKAKKNKDKYVGIANHDMGFTSLTRSSIWDDTKRYKDEFSSWDPHKKSSNSGGTYRDESPEHSAEEGERYSDSVSRVKRRNSFHDAPSTSDNFAISPKEEGTERVTLSSTKRANSSSPMVRMSPTPLPISSPSEFVKNKANEGTTENLLNSEVDTETSEFGDFTAAPAVHHMNSIGTAGEQNFADFDSAFSQMNIQTGAGSPISSTGTTAGSQGGNAGSNELNKDLMGLSSQISMSSIMYSPTYMPTTSVSSGISSVPPGMPGMTPMWGGARSHASMMMPGNLAFPQGMVPMGQTPIYMSPMPTQVPPPVMMMNVVPQVQTQPQPVSSPANDILSGTGAPPPVTPQNVLTPLQHGVNIGPSSASANAQHAGMWNVTGKVNIDLDNLMGKTQSKVQAPSINQLKQQGQSGASGASSFQGWPTSPLQSTPPQKSFLSACIGGMSIGGVLAWTSPALPQLEKEWKITKEQQSWIGAFVPIGAIFAPILIAPLMDQTKGRTVAEVMQLFSGHVPYQPLSGTLRKGLGANCWLSQVTPGAMI
ncbi:unnamed protein product [Darwinula stevensoni]|uniref:ENTH domain-containing protein n=1 Tax=Darwinula stevensoni TaxID=69355 RepID=A0A7R8X466_9CRUS|nr:unnamed protein product [Darwinula stevensoni]CAG0885711.1 unnamed protein product [Darwinula stevensoni]